MLHRFSFEQPEAGSCHVLRWAAVERASALGVMSLVWGILRGLLLQMQSVGGAGVRGS